ncbi:hypothetical protein [Paenibacillus sp. MMS20-IR301]|uniref:hypothetical protein n=1 Tax=Paenibacillus sp. MMS20-IR301 TaxID=2895946 RepID=UPI0028E98AFB|nr:hypothetical protein [Paenibacillus sp. MMS20-IR301]WNS46911.1 hypothetical protein LOS79_12795 [Paenibacillus sp. MMS20-IR301]
MLNQVNQKVFIGSGNLYSRKASNWSQLRAGTHKNVGLQKEWDKFGEDQFKFVILFECEDAADVSFLNKCERYWLDLTKATRKEYGYNTNRQAHKNEDFVLKIECLEKVAE